jgi:hypothetical protein
MCTNDSRTEAKGTLHFVSASSVGEDQAEDRVSYSSQPSRSSSRLLDGGPLADLHVAVVVGNLNTGALVPGAAIGPRPLQALEVAGLRRLATGILVPWAALHEEEEKPFVRCADQRMQEGSRRPWGDSPLGK